MPLRTSALPAGPNNVLNLRAIWPTLALVTLCVIAVATGVAWYGFRAQRDSARAELQAVADLRQAQVENWLRERLNQARFASSSVALATAYERWLDGQDDAALAQLLDRLIEMRKANDSDAVLVLGPQGRPVAREMPSQQDISPELQQTALRAMAEHTVMQTGLYRRDGSTMPMRLDIVIPFAREDGPALGAFVLRLDPRRFLYPTLRAWPVPSDSGESLLWRRQGDQAVAISEFRHLPDTAGRLMRPLSAMLPITRVLRGDAGTATPFTAVDYRGARVLATVRQVAETDWWLSTKLDLAEIDEPAWATAAWAAGAALAVLIALMMGTRAVLQRARVRALEREREEQRERSQTLYLLQSIADNSSDVIFAKDLQGRYLLYNRAGCELIGRSAQQVLGADDAELFPPDVAAQLKANDARVLAAGHNQNFEERLVTTAGPRVQLCTRGPLRNPEGTVIGLFGVARDVTERRVLDLELERHRSHLQDLVDERTQALRQANVQLADTERFVRAVADNLPGRIAYWDRDLRCRFANRTYFTWFGRTPEQVLGHTVLEIFGEAYLQTTSLQLNAALAGEAQHFERETRRDDGALFQHLVHYVPDFDTDGNVRGVFVLAFDISAQKHAEAALKRANVDLVQARDRAESANRSKSIFLANMSHEIRTPMNAVIGLSHLMQRDSRDAVQRDRLDKISNSAHHLLRIINDILDLSKIEAGRMELEQIEFSLDALLARTFEMVSSTARDKGIEMVLDTDHLPDRMRGDPTRVAQALLNMLSNAVKFTDSGYVRLFAELLGEDEERLHVRFAVHDTGTGIPPDRLPALFSAFEQVDSSTSRRFGGTGLGLALTQRLATMMGGETGVESELGVGSRFWFTAWLGRASQTGDGGTPLGGRRVLLVDDLPEARSALCDRLQMFGMRVAAAASGAEALTMVERAIKAGEVYDVLLIDWRMEPLDGVQTLERLRRLLGAGLPPAVLITAYDEDLMRQAAQQARFDAVLVKPITASTLHDTLLRVLRREQAPLLAPTLPGLAETALRKAHGGVRMLVAEDNLVNQELAVELLRSADIEADLAGDGAQAVAMATQTRYAAILMDVQMPGIDGIEASRQLRTAGLSIPIIAMTANAFGEDRSACLAAGMNDHIAKPVDPEQLYSTLLRWLDAASAADAETIGAAPPPRPVAMPPLIGRLASLQGFDTVLALRGAGGRPEVLERLLRRFVEHYAKGVPDMLLDGGDERLRTWNRAAHSLQGACGAIGAVGLQALSRRFEAETRRDVPAETLADQARQIDAELHALVGGLTVVLEG